MKKPLFLGVIIFLLTLTVLTGCTGAVSTVPTGTLPESIVTEAPDDIVFTPGGYAYRANVNGSGGGEDIPDIATVNVALSSGSGTVNVNYRDYIETRAGETRNNILFIWRENSFQENELEVYHRDLPDDFELSQIFGGGRPGILLRTLAIRILHGTPVGEYTFEIGIMIDDKDYGTIPCMVNVIE